MVLFNSILLSLSTATAAVAIATKPQGFHDFMKRQTLTSSQTGTNNGFYYSYYDAYTPSPSLTLGSGGSYSISWSSGSGDFVAGKGYMPGSAHAITYSGTYDVSGGSYLSVYGWTTSPLVEYYIMDCFGSFDPSQASGTTHKGTVTTDGGTYDVYEHQQVNQPSIVGTATFQQYFSVRQGCRVGGTITTQNHFTAWSGFGMDLGTFNYQIVAVEAFSGSGSADITVSTAA